MKTNKDKKKIIIDCSLISRDMRGMGIYLKKILDGVKNIHDLEIFLFTNNYDGRMLLNNNFKLCTNIKVKYISLPQPIFEQIYLPFICFLRGIDFLISSGDSGSILKTAKKSILIIHDVLYMKVNKNRISGNTFKRKLGRLYRKIIVSIASKKADYVITVSNFAKRDIIEELHISEEKIKIIPNGVDSSLQLNSYELAMKTRRILFVTGSDKQKNLKPFLKKLITNQELYKSFESIEIVGVNNAKEIDMQENSFVNYHGFVEHNSVKNLYKHSSHFIIPSLYESFGIPALEALMSGCRVFSSNKGALNEILGERGFFFNPNDNDSLNEMIKNLLSSQNITNEEYKQNLDHASKYLWSNSTLKFTNFLNEIR